ncbi:phage minor structural protein [Scopulibacillus darangshiensis]|uniref:Phage minor structural protein n=1 Tax=Scopulibacillus darangshiensis TaxID=442528 RepID=A0A4R2PE47_9BACL|nr:phage tail spike protein [Scopulibacillus darangshiensis]TCP32195.1 phage minor structural protein [Scopulibacillus darangshiensis]
MTTISDLYIFDPFDKLITILSNEAEEACPFWGDLFKEKLNNGSSFSFTCQGNHEDSRHVIAENQVGFYDKDDIFRLFVIREIEDSEDDNGPIIFATCEPSMLELNDEIVEDKRPQNKAAFYALGQVLEDTRWKVGKVAELGAQSTSFYYITVKDAISEIISTWGGELQDRVEINEAGIIGRYIDILPRRGADMGKIWEMDKDILSIKRAIQSYPKTALYGRGSSLEIEETGGFTRKIDFADVEWSVANGDPVDKPLGQEWVGDPEALEAFGHLNTDGSLHHRKGIFEDGEEKDPAGLLKKTWDALQEQQKQLDNFESDVFLLEELTGYEHEKVRLGDTSIAINRNFAKPIEIEERVISFEYSVSDPDNTGKVEMGQFINLFGDSERLDQVESKLYDRSGVWDKMTEATEDGNFVDKVPPVPTNFIVDGLFKNIMVSWDYDASGYIAAYEVYASQIQGFTPDESNLVWKGRGGGYVHKADVGQQWYFRIRTINTHGTVSAFTTEISAQTQKIMTDDMLFGSVTKDILANLSVDAAKLANGSVEETKIANLAVGNAAIQNGAITNAKIGTAAVGFAQIEKAVITDELIAPNANLDGAKIGDATITNAKIIGRLRANQVAIGSDSIFADGFDPTQKATPEDVQNAVDVIDVVARNYILNSDFRDGMNHWVAGAGLIITNPPTEGNWIEKSSVCNNYIRIENPDTTSRYVYQDIDSPSPSPYEKYMFSCFSTSGGITSGTFKVYVRVTYDTATLYDQQAYFNDNPTYDVNSGDIVFPVDLSTIPDATNIKTMRITIRCDFAGTIWQTGFQFEDGTKKTSWKPNTGDTALIYGWRYPGTTYIDGGALYNDSVSTNALKAGTIDTNKFNVSGGTATNYTKIQGAFLESRGQFTRTWNGKTESNNDIKLKFENGYFRARNESLNRSIYVSDFGIATTIDGTDGSGAIEFFSHEYSDSAGVTISSENGHVALRTAPDHNLILDANGVRVDTRGQMWADGFVTNSENCYVGANNEVRMVNKGYADNFPSSVVYRNVRANGYYGSFVAADPNLNVYIGTDLELRVTSRGMADDPNNIYYRPVRTNGVITGYTNLYLSAADEVRITNSGSDKWGSGGFTYGNLRTNTVYTTAVDINPIGAAQNVYIRPSSGAEVIATVTGTTGSYVPVRASSFPTGSLEKYKTNITEMTVSALDIIDASKVYEYNLISELDAGKNKLRHGLVIGRETPIEVIDGDGVEQYAMNSLSWKAVQELSSKVKDLQNQINELKGAA